MEIIFWTFLLIVFYAFIGYGIVMTILCWAKRKKASTQPIEHWPILTLLIAAYNEEDIIEQKIQNCLNLDYPKDKLKIAFVTDGSTDGTVDIIKKYPQVILFHRKARKGKIAAINRVMELIDTPFTVFSDANVMINQKGLQNLIKKFSRSSIAAVSGEKTIHIDGIHGASTAGEGIYWKYESYLKKKDAEWNTLVGSAGEFFAIRTHLYEKLDTTTLIEDFVLTMKLAAKGYKVDYAPDALAVETGSLNISEETKRKVRISAGGIQAILALKHLLNPFRYGKLTFQYISHRVIRWTLMPPSLPIILISNGFLLQTSYVYQLLFGLQCLFYLLALIGYLLRNYKTKYILFFAPYYFTYMHYCVILGWKKFLTKEQKVTWDKSKRATNIVATTN